MAYATSNPPYLISQGIGGAQKCWEYSSTDNAAAVRVDGYFTNVFDLGMRIGDNVRVLDTDDNAVTNHTVLTGSATVNIDLSDGLAIGTTDTD